jgi:hypothetical protein
LHRGVRDDVLLTFVQPDGTKTEWNRIDIDIVSGRCPDWSTYPARRTTATGANWTSGDRLTLPARPTRRSSYSTGSSGGPFLSEGWAMMGPDLDEGND